MTKTQISIINALQNGLPLTEEPFQDVAREAGVSQNQLLDQIDAWKTNGTLRRFGAILRHHRAGYSANAMGVWNVPNDRAEAFGRAAARFINVTHCYQRPRLPGYDFNLYTMIHGASADECENTALEISNQTGITDYALLYTVAEFKKSSPVYVFDGPEEPRD